MKIHIVLVYPEIPHNTGAIGRLCVGLDAELHLIRPLGFSLDEAALKRSGLDYWEHVDVTVHKNWESFLKTEKPEQMLFASTRGKHDIYEIVMSDGIYLVFGNETSGLPDDIYETYEDQLVQIPMPGKHARSINLANAASIAAYEAYRQIGLRTTDH
jgi:tRNA (cytidine/uridine-2'-O-)-methyltransferase